MAFTRYGQLLPSTCGWPGMLKAVKKQAVISVGDIEPVTGQVIQRRSVAATQPGTEMSDSSYMVRQILNKRAEDAGARMLDVPASHVVQTSPVQASPVHRVHAVARQRDPIEVCVCFFMSPPQGPAWARSSWKHCFCLSFLFFVLLMACLIWYLNYEYYTGELPVWFEVQTCVDSEASVERSWFSVARMVSSFEYASACPLVLNKTQAAVNFTLLPYHGFASIVSTGDWKPVICVLRHFR